MRRIALVVAALMSTIGVLTTPRAQADDDVTVAIGQLSVSGAMWYPGLGPPAWASFTFSSAAVSMAGSLVGHCGQFSGSADMTVGTHSGPVAIQATGNIVFISGSWSGHTVTGYGMIRPLGSELSCLTSPAWQFTLTLTVVVSTSGVPVVTVPPTTSTTVPFPAGGTATSSGTCTTGTVINDGTVGGLYTKVRIVQADSETTWVCVRIGDNASNGFGGKLVVTSPAPGIPTIGMPSADSNFSACGTTSGNTAPGPHPIAKGETVGGTQYEIDVYQGGGQVWLCVRAGSIQHRVIVPTDLPTVPGLPGARWEPDSGTPG